jgi:hypothetical protein
VSTDKPEEATRRNTTLTVIAGRVDDRPIVLDEIVDAALLRETHRMLSDAD